VGQPPVDRAREAAAEQVERARLTVRRLFGLDRSGPPPPQTLPGQPWHVWTLPNGIGLVRLALIPLFLGLGLSSENGTDPLPATIYPVVDRLLIISGGAVCWYHELLPRWALAVLLGRELFMLAAGRYALRRGVELKINWWGRLAVTPVMAALFAGLVGWETAGAVLIYVGLAMALVATEQYARSARRQLADHAR